MKHIKTIISILLFIILLTGCAKKITEGYVYYKEFRQEKTTVMIIPMVISNGKSCTTMMIPMVHRYPDRWVIFIKAYNEEKKAFETEDFYVTEEVYNNINIGDYFIFDDEMGTDEEPCTKERA